VFSGEVPLEDERMIAALRAVMSALFGVVPLMGDWPTTGKAQ
jgi:hypothetical protein